MKRFPNYTKRHNVAYVGPYPPDRTGAAMFTMDLVNATDLFGWQSVVISTVNSASDATLAVVDRKVGTVIIADDPASYASAAEYVRKSDIGAVCIHYIPSLYGDTAADCLPLFARSVQCPVVVVMHSIDPEPSPAVLRTVRALAPLANIFVSMAHAGAPVLQQVYSIPRAKIRYIPHGTPFIGCGVADRADCKQRLGLTNRTVLASFGSLSPHKGFDDAIAALPAVVADHPEIIYLVLGISRREAKTRDDQAHCEHLIRLAHELGVGDHVVVYNEQLDLCRLIDYLTATDIYIHAEHADPHRIMSGSLAYALAAGTLIVSTPTAYAKELLANRRGYLFPFRDVHALSQRIRTILDEPIESEAVRQRAYGYGRGMTWEDVGVKYVELFNDLIQNSSPAQTNEHSDTKAGRGLSSMDIWEKARMDSIAPTNDEA